MKLARKTRKREGNYCGTIKLLLGITLCSVCVNQTAWNYYCSVVQPNQSVMDFWGSQSTWNQCGLMIDTLFRAATVSRGSGNTWHYSRARSTAAVANRGQGLPQRALTSHRGTMVSKRSFSRSNGKGAILKSNVTSFGRGSRPDFPENNLPSIVPTPPQSSRNRLYTDTENKKVLEVHLYTNIETKMCA